MACPTLGLLARLGCAMVVAGPIQAQEWVRSGGGTDPLGRPQPITFQMPGVPLGSQQPWRPNEAAALVIGCSSTPPAVSIVAVNLPPIAVDGQRYFRVEGDSGNAFVSVLPATARVDDGEPHPVEWRDMGGARAGVELTGPRKFTVPEWTGLRDILRNGDALTVGLPTHARGMYYWRFPLQGFSARESECEANRPLRPRPPGTALKSPKLAGQAASPLLNNPLKASDAYTPVKRGRKRTETVADPG